MPRPSVCPPLQLLRSPTRSEGAVIVIRWCLFVFFTVQSFVILFTLFTPSSTNGGVQARPQAATQRSCTGFLCEYTQLNNEILAAQGDQQKLTAIMQRLEQLRQRDQQESQRREDARRRAEQEERRRNEQQRERERERRRQEEDRRSAERSRGNQKTTWLTLGLCIGAVVFIVGCFCYCAKVCNEDGVTNATGGVGRKDYQLDESGAGQTHVPGGFIFHPGPTTATYNFTPEGGQSCTFTPLGVGEPIPATTMPRNPSPRIQPRAASNGDAMSPSAPPPEYHEALNYPSNEDEEPDSRSDGWWKRKIPGPT